MSQINKFCDLEGGCKDDQRIYGIIDPKANKLYRLTFSKSLADLISAKTGFKTRRFRYHIGEDLKPGDDSPSGLYALLDAESDLALRISLDKRISEIHCDWQYRKLATAYISPL